MPDSTSSSATAKENAAADRPSMRQSFLEKIRKAGLFLAKPHFFFYLLIWLMVILVWGTVAQKDMGLYRAQQKFFSSFFFSAGPVFLPGGFLTLGLLTLSLVAKLVFATRWNRRSLGINVTHIGAFLLLFGGFLTAVFSTEGSMAIPEGKQTSIITDYYHSELVIRDTSPKDSNKVTTFSYGHLQEGNVLQHETVPFTIKVLDTCQNCNVAPRQVATSPSVHGFLRNFELQEAPLEKEAERNRFGLRFAVSGTTDADGEYAVFEFMPVVQKIRTAGKEFEVEVRRQETKLPFTIALLDFEKTIHPGTEVAKSYSSRVALIENGSRQEYTISMNQPLRHKGYTFYQASFVESNGPDTTVLAVVKNVGRTFPYISSLIMCLGLLVHLFSMLPQLIAQRSVA